MKLQLHETRDAAPGAKITLPTGARVAACVYRSGLEDEALGRVPLCPRLAPVAGQPAQTSAFLRLLSKSPGPPAMGDPGGGTTYWKLGASTIVFSTSSMLSELPLVGGNSLKVSRKRVTRAWAGTNIHIWSA